MLRILVDMDGVVADMTPRWTEWINGIHGEYVHPDDVNQWDIHKCYMTLTAKQAIDVLKIEGFFKDLPVMEDSIEVLKGFVEAGHDVHFVTAAVAGYEDKLEWVDKFFPFIGSHKTTITHSKHIIPGDVLIDDKVENLENWDETNSHGLPICYDQPYNRHYLGRRATNWKQVKEMVEKWDSIGKRYYAHATH